MATRTRYSLLVTGPSRPDTPPSAYRQLRGSIAREAHSHGVHVGDAHRGPGRGPRVARGALGAEAVASAATMVVAKTCEHAQLPGPHRDPGAKVSTAPSAAPRASPRLALPGPGSALLRPPLPARGAAAPPQRLPRRQPRMINARVWTRLYARRRAVYPYFIKLSQPRATVEHIAEASTKHARRGGQRHRQR